MKLSQHINDQDNESLSKKQGENTPKIHYIH